MLGPGSHRGLTSINTEIAALTRLGNPAISPAQKSRQSLQIARADASTSPNWFANYQPAIDNEAEAHAERAAGLSLIRVCIKFY
jgi:hypothetical protein